MAGIVDLDELILRCRNDRSRDYIAEAVGCYRAGAYRSSIVATWIAVVLDILGKLNELELAGDAKAATQLRRFESIRSGGDARLVDALAFERDILTLAATDFELLTPLEKEELLRLQSDRNKCAHPSMQSQLEAYQPTAEAARSHLRHAVDMMLAREPVQGKAALDRLFDEVKSSYFPEAVADAVAHFKRSALTRARFSLIRNFMIGITKAYFNGDKPSAERRRMRAAIGAVLEIHRQPAEKVVRDDLVEVIRGIRDEKVWMIVAFTYQFPLVWDALGTAIQGKVRTYIQNSSDDDEMIMPALSAATTMPDLRDAAVARILGLSIADFAAVASERPNSLFCDRVVEHFHSVRGFRLAEQFARAAIITHATLMTHQQIAGVLEAVKTNGQINGAAGMQEILCEFFDLVFVPSMKAEWQGLLNALLDLDESRALGVTHKYATLRDRLERAEIWPVAEAAN